MLTSDVAAVVASGGVIVEHLDDVRPQPLLALHIPPPELFELDLPVLVRVKLSAVKMGITRIANKTNRTGN